MDFADERLTPIARLVGVLDIHLFQKICIISRPQVLLNPELVDMGTTGFGIRRRFFRTKFR